MEKQNKFESFAQGYLKDNDEDILNVYDRYAGLRDGAIWQKLQLIGKAIAWLSEHNRRDFTDFDGLGGAVFHKNRMLNAFRRAMMED